MRVNKDELWLILAELRIPNKLKRLCELCDVSKYKALTQIFSNIREDLNNAFYLALSGIVRRSEINQDGSIVINELAEQGKTVRGRESRSFF